MTNFRITGQSNPELEELRELMDEHQNRWWLDAMTKGEYPAKLAAYLGDNLTQLIHPGDMEIVKIPTDFLGINYYSDSFIGAPDADAQPMRNVGIYPFHHRSAGTPPPPYTDMGWPITPEGFYDLLVRIHNDWPEITDIQISENGSAYDDAPDASGRVTDQRRTDYLLAHIDAMGRAVAHGVPVTHYFAWSLMDNFEWAEGYAKRFGMVYVDFKTQQRFIKDSAIVYSAIISNHVESLTAAAS
jgi:beta-glucosidase